MTMMETASFRAASRTAIDVGACSCCSRRRSEMAPAKTTSQSTVPNSRTPSVSENTAGCPGTCLCRNHIMINEMKEGRGPIMMDTPAAMAKLAEKMTPKEVNTSKRSVEDFLDMTISQCGVWAGENIEPDKQPSENHADRALPARSIRDAPASGFPADRTFRARPRNGRRGYNAMTRSRGCSPPATRVGASGQQFSFGVRMPKAHRRESDGQVRARTTRLDTPELARSVADLVEEIYRPVKTFLQHKDYNHRDRRHSALHHAEDAAVPPAEDHGYGILRGV